MKQNDLLKLSKAANRTQCSLLQRRSHWWQNKIRKNQCGKKHTHLSCKNATWQLSWKTIFFSKQPNVVNNRGARLGANVKNVTYNVQNTSEYINKNTRHTSKMWCNICFSLLISTSGKNPDTISLNSVRISANILRHYITFARHTCTIIIAHHIYSSLACIYVYHTKYTIVKPVSIICESIKEKKICLFQSKLNMI